jgi:hypothetical protein
MEWAFGPEDLPKLWPREIIRFPSRSGSPTFPATTHIYLRDIPITSTSNALLREAKGSFFEGRARVPTIVR